MKWVLIAVLALFPTFVSASQTNQTVIAADYTDYTVKSGDTLWDLSRKNGITLTSLTEANHIDLNNYILLPGDLLHIPTKITITVGENPIAEAKHQIEAEAAAKAKAAQQQAQAQAAAAAKAKAQAQAQAQQQAAQQQQAATTTVNKGTFKLSFYDPAVLGSDMGYGGVAANLSVFPKGTQLKITLSDGTVWHRVVNDTGTFAAGNPNQLDVAMPNSAIPSAGILYATVEVVG